jgi:carbamoylphosphate synthase small subunit
LDNKTAERGYNSSSCMRTTRAVLKLLDSDKISNRTKHIDTRYFAKDLKAKGQVKFMYCASDDMTADILTKPLEAVKTHKLTSLMTNFTG